MQDTKNSQVKFIDDISITPQIASDKTDVKPETQLAFTGNTRSIDIAETPAQKQEADEIHNLSLPAW